MKKLFMQSTVTKLESTPDFKTWMLTNLTEEQRKLFDEFNIYVGAPAGEEFSDIEKINEISYVINMYTWNENTDVNEYLFKLIKFKITDMFNAYKIEYPDVVDTDLAVVNA